MKKTFTIIGSLLVSCGLFAQQLNQLSSLPAARSYRQAANQGQITQDNSEGITSSFMQAGMAATQISSTTRGGGFCDIDEGFETSVPPPSWTLNQFNANETWAQDDYQPPFGTYSATCLYDAALGDQLEQLITPSVNLSTLPTPTLEFSWLGSYDWSVSPNNNCDLNVYLRVNGGSWIFLWNEDGEGVFTSWTWYTNTIDLSAFGSATDVEFMFEYEGNDGAQFSIDQIQVCGVPVINPLDECANAEMLIVNSDGICDASTGSVINATESMPACAGSSGLDVWYTFVADDPTQLIMVDGNGDFDAVVEVFTGTCGALTSIGCIDGTLGGEVELILATGFSVGTTYTMRIFDYYGNPSDPTFSVCVRTPCEVTLPAGTAELEACGDSINDGCNATPTPVYQSMTLGETIVGQAHCDNGTRDLDWYEFTLTETTAVTMSGDAEFPFSMLLVDHSDCNAAVVLSGFAYNPCGAGSFVDTLGAGTYTAVFGTTDFSYYVCSNDYSDYWMTLEGVAIGGLANDDCGGAIDLTVNSSCIYTSADVAGATESMAGCVGTADDDVWFSFTPSTTEATVTVDGSTDFDAVFEVFSGPCTNLVSIACIDATLEDDVEETLLTGLSPGTEYFVRVYDYYTGAPATTGFDICISTPCSISLPPSCTAELEACGDSINDGCNLIGIPPQYQSIACDETICGTIEAEGGLRDTDWYLFTVPSTTDVTMTGSAEFPFAMIFADITDCNNPVVIDSEGGSSCGVSTLTTNLTAGTYVAFFSSSVYEGYPCSSQYKDYWMTLTMDLGTPTASFSAVETELVVDFTDLSVNADSWFWDFGDGNTSTTQNPQHTYALPGAYTACLIATMECGGSDTTCMTVNPDITIGLREGTLGNVKIYPNPNTGEFTIQADNVKGETVINIFDVAGKIVYTENVNVDSGFIKTFDLNVAPGSYVVRMRTDEGIHTEKLSVE